MRIVDDVGIVINIDEVVVSHLPVDREHDQDEGENHWPF
jgi:hypothetical protein